MVQKKAAAAMWLVSLLSTPSLAAIHETLAQVPTGWTTSAVPANQPITLQIALVEQNIDQLESKLMSVSDPSSSNYGNHFSKEDVDGLFPPIDGAVDAVTGWLKSGGIVKIHAEGSFINFHTDVSTAEKLLDTTFARFQQAGESKIRTTQYSVPDDIQKYVDLIHPTTFIGKPSSSIKQGRMIRRDRAVRRSSQIDASCANGLVGSCLKQFYNAESYTPDPSSGSRIGFGSFGNQSSHYLDLQTYEAQNNLTAQNFTVALINGGQNFQGIDRNPANEADLDIETIVSIAGPLPITEFIVGGLPPFIPDINTETNNNEPYLEYYTYLLGQPADNLPQVISNSYGDDERTVPFKYAQKVCNMIGKMGMRGISILESSGDSGVGAGCKSNDGKNTTLFDVTFPGTCPYVTVVGGTQQLPPEIAWTLSTGGFSNYFAAPSYQKDSIAAYIQTASGAEKFQEYNGVYANFSGRGYPDVSAHSSIPNWILTVDNITDVIGAGTSASCPMFASLVALLNDALLRDGKTPLGFLNPLLYSEGFAAKALTDITGGASIGCTGQGAAGAIPGAGVVPGASWNATVGWDPATGLGTPNFPGLKSAVIGS